MTPKKYPQNFIPPKIFIFLKTPKSIEKIKILNLKNDPSLRMYENIRVPPPPPGQLLMTRGFNQSSLLFFDSYTYIFW